MIDQLKMNEAFLPGDVVCAKFLSYGDGRKMFATTAEKGLGVKYGKSETGLMLPLN